jgi:hypothetical protein
MHTYTHILTRKQGAPRDALFHLDPMKASCGLFPMHVSAACVMHCPGFDASAQSPRGASKVERVFKARSPPDKEKGSDTTVRHPASPWVTSKMGSRRVHCTWLLSGLTVRCFWLSRALARTRLPTCACYSTMTPPPRRRPRRRRKKKPVRRVLGPGLGVLL